MKDKEEALDEEFDFGSAVECDDYFGEYSPPKAIRSNASQGSAISGGVLSVGSTGTLAQGSATAGSVLRVGTNGSPTWGLSGSYVGNDEVAKIRRDLEDIKARLCILEPNFTQMEKFQALREAYDHFKCMERLCVDDLPPPKPI